MAEAREWGDEAGTVVSRTGVGGIGSGRQRARGSLGAGQIVVLKR